MVMKHFLSGKFKKNVLAGILTLIPIWITWLVFTFFLNQLIHFGSPWVRALSAVVGRYSTLLADWLLQPWFQSALAVIVTISVLYGLGWFATLLIGKKIILLLDAVIARIPLLQNIYGGTKKMIDALTKKPGDFKRVVLIDFPSTEMKAIGFVTRIMKDEVTGREMAAVYVPTTPNPTSGYLEIVPVENTVPTDWSIDEATTFIISGGSVAPARFHYGAKK